MLLCILTGCANLTSMTGEYEPRETRPEGIEWQASYKEAVRLAGAQNKPMMLVFHGVSSRRLDRNVFPAPDVIELTRNFVCLKIGAGQDDLIQKYKIQNFPTIVFTDPRGGEYQKSIDYQSRSAFVEVLKSALIPVEAEYSLQIKSSQPKATVECVFRNVRWGSLILALRERHGGVYNISYDSTDGRPVWEELETNVWRMKFRTKTMKTVKIQYEVELNIMSSMTYQEYISYVGDDYGVLDGHALFLAPQDLHVTGKARVNLDLPAGWRAITAWKRESSSSFVADLMEEVVDSVFCIGQFQSAKREFGEHEILAAYCGDKKSTPDLEKKVGLAIQIFTDYVMRFGDFPFKSYLAILVGPDPNRKYNIHGSAHGAGFAGHVDWGVYFMAHEIFHVWNGGITNQKSDYEGWFKEGFTEYYGYLTPYRLGLYSKERFVLRLMMLYREYLRKYDTKGDMPLRRVKEELARRETHEQPSSVRSWIMYYKGALVASHLDKEIRNRTDGRRSLDDLMYYIFHEFREREYSSKDILEALNTVTEQDFSQFFSDFVYGTAKLPPITDEVSDLRH